MQGLDRNEYLLYIYREKRNKVQSGTRYVVAKAKTTRPESVRTGKDDRGTQLLICMIGNYLSTLYLLYICS